MCKKSRLQSFFAIFAHVIFFWSSQVDRRLASSVPGKLRGGRGEGQKGDNCKSIPGTVYQQPHLRQQEKENHKNKINQRN